MIEIQNLSKTYGNQVVLNNISINLYFGNIYIVKGNSGSGKSTLLNILGGLDTDYEGSCCVNKEELKNLNEKDMQVYRKQIGYVFQESLLLADLTVLENLLLVCDDLQYIEQLAQIFQVQSLFDRKTTTLSNGERQRVAIIRSIVNHEDIILLDEPSASLDQKNAYILADLIGRLKDKDRIIIIVTHDRCFDHIADVEYSVSYGNFSKVIEKCECKCLSQNKEIVEIKKSSNKIDRILCYRRFLKSQKNIAFVLSTTFIMLIVMLSLFLALHFGSSYERYLYDKYPAWTFRITRVQFEDKVKNKEDFIIHEHYKKDFDEFGGVAYLPKESSSLNNSDVMLYGAFPEDQNDVILNYAYMEKRFPNEFESCIGKKIIVDAKEYRVSGVLTNDEANIKMAMNSNSYYWELPKYTVFFSEEAMLAMDAKSENDEYMVDYVGVDKSDAQKMVLESKGFISYYETIIRERVSSLSFVLSIVYFAIAIIAVLIFSFLYFVIYLDLNNRKKEIGYLQLFGLTKKRVRNLILMDYMMKLLPTSILATSIYFLTLLVIDMYFMSIPIGILEVFLCLLLLFVYVLFLVSMPLRKFLRKSIKNLIT